MTTLQQLTSAQASPEVPINENFETLSALATYGKRQPVTTGLTWGYYGGIWGGIIIADGTLTLSTSTTNYVVVKRVDGVISTSTSATNWTDVANYARVYKLTTSGSVVSATEDHRAGLYGIHGMQLPERRVEPISAAYTFVWADMHATKLHPSADTTARAWAIPANATVAYPIGAELEVINQNAAGVITISITTDTLRLAGAGTTGSRTLAANGWARAKKLTATEWIIRGEGLT
jgi:hypothetical protein